VFSATSSFEGGLQSAGADVNRIHQLPKSARCEQEHKGEFTIAPIPMFNPTLGDGFGAAAIYLVSLDPCDKKVQPSAFAVGGFGTNNGSWGAGGGGNLILRGDRYRITAGVGLGSFHYPYFGIGNDAGTAGAAIQIAQRSKGFLIEPKIRIFRRWFLGPRYHFIDNHVTLDESESGDSSNSPVPLPADELELRTAALGLRLQNDTRDSAFYPRLGGLLDGTFDFYDAAFGGRRSYRSILLAYNRYIGFGSKNVLALHGSVCSVWGSAPFYDLCLLGMSQDLRGYEIGRFRDRRFLAGQVEYRRELFWRLGAVAFIGAGEVGRTFSDFSAADIVPGGGVGLRFLLTRRTHVNLRVDYAWGKNSHALYIGVMEAF
jgi:outer membrane protein assembly factor BamA